MRTKTLKLTLTKLADVTKELQELVAGNPDKAFSVKVGKWDAKRSLSANAQIHLWFGQIAKQREDITPRQVKLLCKQMFGISILLGSKDDHLRERTEYLLDKLDYYNSTYEFQLELVDIVCHTSDFKTAEIKVFMDLMIEYWNDNGCSIGYQD